MLSQWQLIRLLLNHFSSWVLSLIWWSCQLPGLKTWIGSSSSLSFCRPPPPSSLVTDAFWEVSFLGSLASISSSLWLCQRCHPSMVAQGGQLLPCTSVMAVSTWLLFLALVLTYFQAILCSKTPWCKIKIEFCFQAVTFTILHRPVATNRSCHRCVSRALRHAVLQA